MSWGKCPSGIRHFAEEIVTALEDNSIVLIEVPHGQYHDPIIKPLLSELQSLIGGNRQFSDKQLYRFSSDERHPEKSVVMDLVGSDDVNLVDALQTYDERDIGELIEISSCDEEPVLTDRWSRLLKKTARQINQSEIFLKRLCIVLKGLAADKELTNDPNIKTLQLWNVVNWVDMHQIAEWNIPVAGNNPLYRAWQVSSYAGAANLDIGLLEKLCSHQPGSLVEIYGLIRDTTKSNDDSSMNDSIRFTSDLRHRVVPQLLEEAWRKGHVTGMSVERGPQYSLSTVNSENLVNYISHQVWREQISRLYQPVIEMSDHASTWVTEKVSGNWVSFVEGDEDTEYLKIEPGFILRIFKENRKFLPRLPPSLYDLLRSLRTIRNKLAHLEPADSRDINKVWGQYKNASEYYKN